MKLEQWQAVRDLFDQLKDLHPEKRKELFQLCDDPEVRSEAEKLLISHDEAGDFIERPAVSSVIDLSLQNEPALEGRRIGPYRIVREIARGGVAVVWLAVRGDGAYQTQVAIKLIGPRPENDELARHFRLERQILANLSHPNIARLLDGGTTDDGWQFLVMEYVEGSPLTDHCHSKELSIEERISLFRTVCAAVQFAHQHLVVHRDLKPANILVTESGEVKLLDFGIAKLLDPVEGNEGSSRTETGVHLMTPEYASPEQIRGEPISTASDIFSLGIVLYELLTGAKPFRLKSRSMNEIERLICESDPPPPSAGSLEAKDEIAEDLDNIVLKALNKDPQLRYRSAEQLSEDLRRFLDGEVVLARKSSFLYRTSRFIKRNRAGVVVTGIVFLSLVAGVIGTTWEAAVASRHASENRAILYAAQMNLAQQAWDNNNIGRVIELIDSQPKDLRGFEWRYLWRLVHVNGELHRFGHNKEIWSVAFSPDGRLLATGSDDDFSARLWETETGRPLHVLKGHANSVWSVAFSPDGKTLATASHDKTIKLWDVASGKELATLSGHDKRVNAVAFSPDGKRLASGSDDGTVRIWDAGSRKEIQKIVSGSTWVRSLCYSPDGNTIAAGLSDYTVLLDAGSGKRLRLLLPKIGLVWAVAFSPDGKRLASGGNERIIHIWDLQSGNESMAFNETGAIRSLSWSPDGRHLASSDGERIVRFFDLQSKRELAQLKGHLGQIWSVRYSPDGRRLATGGDDFTARVWDVDQALASSIKRPDYGGGTLSLSPDNRLLASGTVLSKRVVIRELESWKVVSYLESHQHWVPAVNYSPNGKYLATASGDHTLKFWSTSDWKELNSINAHLDQINAVVFTPDSTQLVTASFDHLAKLWNVMDGKEVRSFAGHTDRIFAAAISPDGAMLATAGYDLTARIWDIKSGREVARITGHKKPLLAVAFSPDGKLLATGSADSTIRIWQVNSATELASISGHAGHVRALSFSPDGTRLASGGGEGILRLHDTKSWQEVLAVKAHDDAVVSVTYSADGTTLISGGLDGVVRLWRAATQQELGPH